jgi:prefoldin subunit 5
MPKRKSVTSYAQQNVGIRLSSHEKVCAERMETLQEAISELNKEVKSLRQDVSKGKGAVTVLVFLGTLFVSVLGVLNFK